MLPQAKPIYRSRTFWVAVATFAAGALSLLSDNFRQYLTPQVVGLLLTALGLLNAWLRTQTSQPISTPDLGIVMEK